DKWNLCQGYAASRSGSLKYAFGWKRRNPAPRVPKTQLNWQASEWREYEQTMEDWVSRHENAERQSGLTPAPGVAAEAKDWVTETSKRLGRTKATTLEGIRYKARVSKLTECANAEQPIAVSLVDDLLALA